jgi:hypothetical protein
MVRKGDSLPARPHRRARLLAVPEHQAIVPREHLEALAATLDDTGGAAQSAAAQHEPLRAAMASDSASSETREQAYIAAAVRGKLSDAVQALKDSPDGQKHPTLRDRAITCAGYLHYGIISEGDIERELLAAVEGRAADVNQAKKTISDGIAYGKARQLTVAVPARSADADSSPGVEAAPAVSIAELVSAIPGDATREQVHAAALDMVEQAAHLTRGERLRLGEELRERGAGASFVREWASAVGEQSRTHRHTSGGPGGAPPGASENERVSLLQAAREWAENHRDMYAYDAAHQLWRQWAGTHWQAIPDDSTELYDSIGDCLERTGAGDVNSERKVKDALRFARGRAGRLFALRGKIAFANGTFDTSTGELLPHDKADGLTCCLPYPYAAAGETPTISRMLRELFVLPGSDAVMRCHIGLALLRDTKFHKVAVMQGQPGGG